MADAIVVLNAGSSSHQVLAVPCSRTSRRRWRCAARSRASTRAASFVARNRRRRARSPTRDLGRAKARWATTARSAFLLDYLHGELAAASAARGRPPRGPRRHRVRPPGAARLDAARAPRALRPARAAAPAAQPRGDPRAARARAASCRRSPASTPRSIAAMPPVAQAFALPPAITDRGVRRYGFHGLSYEYIAVDAAAASTPRRARPRRRRAPGQRRQHVRDRRRPQRGLDHGLHRGRGPADGHPHAARSTPASLLYLMDELKMDVRAIEKLLYHQSGLLGVSGVSSATCARCSPATIRGRRSRSSSSATAIGRELGSLAAALGGLDALVFTGGIGEHAAPVRAPRAASSRPGSASELDAAANASARPAADDRRAAARRRG